VWKARKDLRGPLARRKHCAGREPWPWLAVAGACCGGRVICSGERATRSWLEASRPKATCEPGSRVALLFALVPAAWLAYEWRRGGRRLPVALKRAPSVRGAGAAGPQIPFSTSRTAVAALVDTSESVGDADLTRASALVAAMQSSRAGTGSSDPSPGLRPRLVCEARRLLRAAAGDQG